MRIAPVIVLLALGLASCHKELPLCGDPAFGKFVSYEIVDASTGQDYFAVAGRSSPDSLRLLAYELGPARPAGRIGTRVRLGPVNVDGRVTSTQLLRFSAHDVDTVVVALRYYPVQQDPCGYGPALEEMSVTYNGRPNSVFRANISTDSLEQVGYQAGKLIKLRKRP